MITNLQEAESKKKFYYPRHRANLFPWKVCTSLHSLY